MQVTNVADEVTDHCVQTLHSVKVPEAVKMVITTYISSATQVTIKFCMENSYMEDLTKPQSCHYWGKGACMKMGTCLRQYDKQQA